MTFDELLDAFDASDLCDDVTQTQGPEDVPEWHVEYDDDADRVAVTQTHDPEDDE